MVLLYTPPGELGTKAPDFSLLGVDGKRHTLTEYTDASALVIMFICNHCPYVQAVEKRLIALAEEMTPMGARFVGINANDTTNYPEDSFENMQKRADDKGYPFDYLLDDSQKVAHAYGAVCTPDFFLFDAEQVLRYRGRLDDSPRYPQNVRHQELKAAITALLEGKTVSKKQNPAMGCSIKWL